jgi:Na+-translocating ferredoxin:NAD+ oxidoreductase subunit A
MKELFLMVLANGLVNNVVLSRFLGLCSFMGVSNKIESAMGMAMATTFVLTMSTCVGWLIEHLILQPLGLEYLRLLAFIMVIASLVQLTELFIAKQSPELHRTLGIFLPLITTNCAVLGIALLTVQEKLTFLETLIYGLSSALGYSLVIVLFAGMRVRMEQTSQPALFRGAPISFITAGILAMAFAGFAGLAG